MVQSIHGGFFSLYTLTLHLASHEYRHQHKGAGVKALIVESDSQGRRS